MITTSPLPRVAPSTVRRIRLERWLASAGVPVRLVTGPAGSGKTTLLLSYLAGSASDTAYCALPLECTAEALHRAIAGALGLPLDGMPYAAATSMRAAITRPTQLAIDDLCNATPEAVESLFHLVEEAPDQLAFLFSSRSRDALDAKTWLTRSLAVECDAAQLAFDLTEAAELAQVCGVPHGPADVARLIYESDGWAIVVSGAIRAAAEDGRSLRDAYEQWRKRYGRFFLEFVESDLRRASDEDRALVRRLIEGAPVEDLPRLRRLEQRGLFVVADGDGYRTYRALQRAGACGGSSRAHECPPLVVRLFGRFQARIDGRDLRWVRRRDQQFVKYLLLKPDGRASRSELISVFWPSADRHLAAQTVRTTCSNIRRALAQQVGHAYVDRYFQSCGDISMNLQNVVCDVRRFTAHANEGDGAFERGDRDQAGMHYGAAAELYAGSLLQDEMPQPWFASLAQTLEDRYWLLLERLAQAALQAGDVRAASALFGRMAAQHRSALGA